ARLGEILVAIADRGRRVDELDVGRAVGRSRDRARKVGEAPRLAAADVVEAGQRLLPAHPQHGLDAVADPDEIPQLAAIGVVGAMRAEQTRLLAGTEPLMDLPGDADLAGLVIFVRAVDVEELEPGPGVRVPPVRGEAGHAPVEQMLRPAIGVERPKLGQRSGAELVLETGAAVAIGRGRGGVDETRAMAGAPL